MQAPTQNAITQGKHGTYNAVDYSWSPDPTVYAPEDMTWHAYLENAGDAGNNLQMNGATGRHGFCHLERILISPGQSVKRGEPIAVMGYTGYTIPAGPGGRHLHWVLLRNSIYVYPPSFVNEEPNKGGDMPDKLSLGPARVLAETVLGRDPEKVHNGDYDDDLQTNHVGRDLTNEYINDLYFSDEAELTAKDRKAKDDFYEQYSQAVPALEASVKDLTRKLEIAQASDPNSDATRWQTLKTLIKALMS